MVGCVLKEQCHETVVTGVCFMSFDNVQYAEHANEFFGQAVKGRAQHC